MERKKKSNEVILDDDDDDEEEEEEEDEEVVKILTTTTAADVTNVSNSSVGKHADTPLLRLYTIIDFLNDVWIPHYSANKNLRLVVGFLSKKISMLNERNIEPNRQRECAEMRSVITDLLTEWMREGGPVGESCSKETLQRFLVAYRSKKFDANKVDPFLTRDILKDKTAFVKWTTEYNDYLTNLFGRIHAMRACSLKKRIIPTVVSSIDGNNCEEEQEQEEEEEEEEGTSSLKNNDMQKKKKMKKNEEENEREIDVLFDSSIFDDSEKQRLEEKSNKLPQFMTKLEKDGNLCTWRTPGEIGKSLIRIEVYNFKDIVQKEKRTWWKSARLRTQFLSQESCPSRLTGLLNEVAMQMSKTSGLTTEKRGVII